MKCVVVRATLPGTLVVPPPSDELSYLPYSLLRFLSFFVVVEPRPHRGSRAAHTQNMRSTHPSIRYHNAAVLQLRHHDLGRVADVIWFRAEVSCQIRTPSEIRLTSHFNLETPLPLVGT